MLFGAFPSFSTTILSESDIVVEKEGRAITTHSFCPQKEEGKKEFKHAVLSLTQNVVRNKISVIHHKTNLAREKHLKFTLKIKFKMDILYSKILVLVVLGVVALSNYIDWRNRNTPRTEP